MAPRQLTNPSRRVAAVGASCLVLLLGLATADSFVHPSAKQPFPAAVAVLHRARGGATTTTAAPGVSFLKPLPSTTTSSLLTVAQQQQAAERPQQCALAVKQLVSKLAARRGGAAAAATAAATGEKGLWEKARVWVFIGLWYVFNVAFNIYNKKVLIALPLPWTVSIAQLGT